jgi:DNA-binding SARP family transcriptional activator
VRIHVCGDLRIEGDGAALTARDLPGRQGRRLWAYLALNRRRPSGMGELATAVWGDAIPDAWEAGLHALVSRVRSAVRRVDPAVALRSTGAGYELSLPAGTFVDRERAWEAIHHVRLTHRRGDIASAWTEAVIAHEIAARGFLPGESGEWIEAERRLLRGIEIQALEAITEAELARARHDEVERVARQLIELDPVRESGYRLLVRGLRASGNPAAATAVIAECRAALATVGARPSAETEAIFRASTITGAR